MPNETKDKKKRKEKKRKIILKGRKKIFSFFFLNEFRKRSKVFLISSVRFEYEYDF